MWKEDVTSGEGGEIIRKRFLVYPGKNVKEECSITERMHVII